MTCLFARGRGTSMIRWWRCGWSTRCSPKLLGWIVLRSQSDMALTSAVDELDEAAQVAESVVVWLEAQVH